MQWSIIIVSYNCLEPLLKCLDSLKSLAEVIVVDNASTDGTVLKLQKQFPEITSIVNDHNAGFAYAANQGAKKATGTNLLFLNPDTIINPSVLDVLRLSLEKAGVGIVAPQLVDEFGKDEKFAAGYFPTLGRLVTRRIAVVTKTSAVDWVSGAALAIKRELFLRLQGFDEQFFMYYEDIDLCLRAKQLGFETVVAPFHIVHKRGQSLSNNTLRKNYYYRSQSLYFKKHFGTMYAWAIALVRLPLKFRNV